VRIPLATAALSFVLLTACARTEADPSAASAKPLDRTALYDALRTRGALESGRLLSHVSHTCSLHIGDASYPVVDLRELVPSETSPRGVNAILILSPALDLVFRIDYADERPLFCRGGKLYVQGDISGSDLPGEGNEITFGEGGLPVSQRHVEAAEVPAFKLPSDTVQ